MVFKRSSEKHLSTYFFQIIETKHITFNKGEYVGHLEPTLTDDTIIDQTEAHCTNSVTLQKMMAEQVKPDTFDPPCDMLKTNTQSKFDALLKE